MPPLSILIKPASSACNLRCAYCFYADEASIRAVPNYGLMSREVSHALIEKAAGAAEGSITFLFQGGEPTLAGLDFYRDFVSYVRETVPDGLAVRYAIQTNGMLLDGDWCRFFRENRFLVGLSLDGTRECHDRFRRDGAGKGTYDQVMKAARLLEETGVEYNVLTVVTGYLARHIQGVFSALCKRGFRFQQYIPCLDPLEEARGGQGYSLSPEQYGSFLKTLFDLWYRELERGRYWSIRYFDNLIWMLDGHAPEQCSMWGCCGLQYLVEADGSVYPCDFYGLDEYRLGNIRRDSWEELDRAREKIGFVEASRRIPEECGSCRWYPLCRNGCRRDRAVEEDGLGRNYYCRAYAGFFAYALPRLRQAHSMLRTR
ncbi:anaerobic sulfatase maturase [Colidextribacter sp. OB.20]|uniref:anaerobic sulfatase maturase n=1 Tax=Colidextribacter sp. OB.20 TaxID=2304568 RepID=UPI00136F5A9A|nr:anaerobic sulfatase maturase [Colidextribacter sp. OB.20]NBI11805.1 anaerobic sulfatase maturase [Colidextribacter sp. OB.20]